MYEPAVGTILETNGERDTGCKFTMKLGLCGTCADRAPGHHWTGMRKEETKKDKEKTYSRRHTEVRWYRGVRNRQACQGL